MVSRHYDPNGNVNNSPTSLNLKCYSSWYFSNEITDKIIGVTSPGEINSWFDVYTINGFYGKMNNNIWHGVRVANPYIQYDFGKVVKIQKVLVKIRNAGGANTEFTDVEVRVGNTSSTGDFSQFTLLDDYPGPGVNNELVPFEGPEPLWGRYLSVQRLGNNRWFEFASINVLGEY